MQFFLDTANLDQIKEAVSWGIIDGVTTNPSLVSKENMKFEELIKEICRTVPGPVSVESVSTRAKDIIECHEVVKVACVLKGVVRDIKADQRFFNRITTG